VVIGSLVKLLPAAVSHGNLVVSISENYQTSQPAPFARRGETVVTPDSTVSAEQEGGRMFYIDPGVTLQDLVAAVNRVGVAPGDLVAILEALEKAGALRAELIVI
jgi:flagellar P-ring protein precursor FlgI